MPSRGARQTGQISSRTRDCFLALPHREKHIHIQKEDHGKSSSSRRTISDVSGGVPGRERRTFSPLKGQM
jgi:hypothetical protein